jgi:pyrroline-5-carboxylate reductase
MSKIGFIGAGNMAQAIIKGIIDAKLYKPADIFISDIRPQRVLQLCNEYKIKSAENNRQLVKTVDILFLSVKPQNMQQVLEEIKDSISENLLVVSIAAGITTSRIQKSLGNVPIIRAMPNTPALLGQGATGIYATKQAADKLNIVEKIFSAIGITVVVNNENLLNIITALSGSGPAYFFLLMEEMINTAQKLGLEKSLAEKLVLQTAKGAGILASDASNKNQSPQILRKNVTSPGGTTEAALKVFSEHNFSKIIENALTAAANRAHQLSKE